MLNLVPDEDDMPLHHEKKRKKGADTFQNDYRPKQSSTSSFGTLLSVVSLLLVGGLGYAAFLMYQEMTLLVEKNTVLEQQLEKINETILNAEKSSGSSVLSLNQQVNTNLTEIKKLWDVANKRNKNDIIDSKNQITAFSKDLTSLNEKYQKHVSTMQASIAALAAETKTLKGVETSVKTIDTAMAKMNTSIAQHQSLLDKHSGLLKALSGATSTQDIQTRVKEIELAISSIDQSRIQFNQRLNTLQGSVNDLKLSVETKK